MTLAAPLMPFTPPAHPARYGLVRISKLAFDMAAAEGMDIFDRFLPLKVHVDATREEIVVSGYHPSFDEIEVDSIIPEYVGTFVDGRTVPHWTRVTPRPDPQP